MLKNALISIGLTLGPAGWALAIAGTALITLIIENKEELAKWFDPGKPVSESWAAQGLIVALQKIVEWSPANWLSGGAWGDWWDQNVVYLLTERILDSEEPISESVTKGVYDPTMNMFTKLDEDLLGLSVVPEMVEGILEWFEKLTLDLTPFLDRLTAKFNVLTKAIQGVPPVPKDLIAFDAGNLKIVTVNLQGSTFGAGLSEREIRDWIFQSLADVLA